MVIKIKKGFNIPIAGNAEKTVRDGLNPSRVSIKPADFKGIRPKLLVKKGDSVSIGTPLVEDKNNPAIRLVSPGGGKVASIVRGERRKLELVSIDVDEQESSVSFPSFTSSDLDALSKEKITEQLLATGLWPLIQQRPYGKIANPEVSPRSVYISGMNTEPLAADPEFLLTGRDEYFKAGLKIITKLTKGKTYLCISSECKTPFLANAEGVDVRKFSGPHPAGLPGTHIQFTEPFRKGDIIWTLRAPDVALMGELFLTGRLSVERLVCLAGPGVKEPCYVKTRVGAPVSVIAGEMCKNEPLRYISGTILSGQEETPDNYLAFAATTMTVLLLNKEKKFLGWLMPQFDTFSWFRLYGGHFRKKLYPMSAMLHSGPRAILPVGCDKNLTPLDIYPAFLIKSILAGDLEEAEDLGLLECLEEDMALITYADPSKINYGEILTQGLARHEKEG